jgi:hypothetical protein
MKSRPAAGFAPLNFSRRLACSLLLFAWACALRPAAAQAPDRANLFPKLRVGQVFRYRVSYRSNTRSNTESNVAAPMAPTAGEVNAQLLLFAEVTDVRLEAGKPVSRIRTRIVEPDVTSAAPANPAPPLSGTDNTPPPGKLVEFSLHADGQITGPDGLDQLSSDEQAAWQEWLARFAAAGIYPEKGVKSGDKWKAEEQVSSAILAALSWEKESEYVNNEPCSAAQLTVQGDPAFAAKPQETCAVILTTATLKQKSNPKDATPEDYKLHDLRTLGTASGKNEVISYISLKTGLLVRATEDTHQTMNAMVAKSDGSNRVRYAIDAESHAQVLLLADPASNPPQ